MDLMGILTVAHTEEYENMLMAWIKGLDTRVLYSDFQAMDWVTGFRV